MLAWAMIVASAMAVSAASPWSTIPLQRKDTTSRNHARTALPDSDVFHDMFMALSDMQDAYFQRWLGTWPEGIDWTRAVVNTHVAATLRTISDELELARPAKTAECATRKEELIAGYFADVIAYYFGEDAFALRNQAYDDMLWVVLGWLESIRFVDEHGRLISSGASAGGAETWYGSRWIPAFAHRARIFWELAAKGWDTTLCGGGMLWNPRLMPYKNAVTNQLFISASISMYLHFPGDANASPFRTNATLDQPPPARTVDWRAHDPIFGRAAQEAHRWLAASNMTNPQGLYADGFHISGHPAGSNNTKCDTRDEMVYTYNQGVILSGLLGLFQATGREVYLREGHALVQNVIRATGYDLRRDAPVDKVSTARLPPWRGLGRAGVLEEACDVRGTCSQDAQTFKGIWMHHFASFCAADALDGKHVRYADNTEMSEAVLARIRERHGEGCRRYLPWLRRNARAAMGTRDGKGLFGMWWTAGLFEIARAQVEEEMVKPVPPLPVEEDGDEDMVDYRNDGVPYNQVWMKIADLPKGTPPPKDEAAGQGQQQKPLGGGDKTKRHDKRGTKEEGGAWDPNLRGRGRTVETQSGGLAVLRALWVLSRHEL
ncbi:hypothetical protein C8A05DRAFT_18303 [Staphylotrichum tortipilum]|uniref:Glycosyl hydrolase n=1 Tax=Staphylotrichum tortipilum TaxID=2831512 RepID=A0AAN6MFG3_9PEZI|nr:hypothetical protein C8A05DRAFT_18303 [Staphylotrichum longicolle]